MHAKMSAPFNETDRARDHHSAPVNLLIRATFGELGKAFPMFRMIGPDVVKDAVLKAICEVAYAMGSIDATEEQVSINLYDEARGIAAAQTECDHGPDEEHRDGARSFNTMADAMEVIAGGPPSPADLRMVRALVNDRDKANPADIVNRTLGDLLGEIDPDDGR